MKREITLSHLTKPQIIGLCSLANLAYKRAKERGGIEEGDTAETFRRREQLAAVKVESLKQMHQGHYRSLKAHWLYLIGLLGPAYELLIKTGDGQEQRELMQWQISGCAANLAIAFQHNGQKLDGAVDGAWAYILKLARVKFEGRKLSDLDTLEMVQLRDTVINRTNAQMGRGKAENRNKSQRAKKPAPTAEEYEFEEVAQGHRREAAVTPS